MKQFQGSLGPIQELQPKRLPAVPKSAFEDELLDVAMYEQRAVTGRSKPRAMSPDTIIDLGIVFVIGLVLLAVFK